MDSLWKVCQAPNHISNIDCHAFRIVENQAKSATRKLVSTSEEHDILEKLLENSKPKLPETLSIPHYLLFTPFRYPPLNHGSRFATKHERSLFYCSLKLKTAMAEKAFYRLTFNRDTQAPLGGKVIRLTSFQAHLKTRLGLDLCNSPFEEFKSRISSPLSYQTSQPLGKEMRQNGIEAFSYFSARCLDKGKNLGLFSPNAFGNNDALKKTYQTWCCYSTKEVVEFSDSNFKERHIFQASDFMVDGHFPKIPH